MCKDLGIRREEDDGKDLTSPSSEIWLEDDNYEPSNMRSSQRIGLSKAKEKMLRFYVEDNRILKKAHS